MMSGFADPGGLLARGLVMATGLAATYYMVHYLMDLMDPSVKRAKEVSKYVSRLLRALGRPNIKLTNSEMRVACDLVNPSDMEVTWDDIGGLNEVADSLKEAIIWPLRHQQLFGSSSLLQPPKGILMHGPPGCGKTMLAKAVAAEEGICFLNVQTSTLLDLWHGETEKLTAAIFSLAQKLQPSIIFIDEIDLLLRTRRSQDFESTANLKGQFMSLCDGLLTDKQSRIMILGATNRPDDIDEAILRRLPLKFHVSLPTTAQRAAILEVILRNENLAEDVDVMCIARETVGKSGADLKEICRRAAMTALRELVSETSVNDDSSHEGDRRMRPIRMSDFQAACPGYVACANDLVD